MKVPPRCGNSRGLDPRRYPVSAHNSTGERSRHPYPNAGGTRTTYEERVSARYCPQLPCSCGCGLPAKWDRSSGRWAKYAKGHYRRPAEYKDREWLHDAYVVQGKTMQEIGDEFGVNRSVIRKFVTKFGIPTRNRSASRMGRKVGPKNPSWRGGISEWEYAHNWKSIARAIRDRDKWTCQLCRETRKRWGKELHVHHIDGNKLNNDSSNLVSLCARCHPRGAKADEMADQLRSIVRDGGRD